MNATHTTLWRLLLSPRTSWRALRLMRRARKYASPPRRLTFDAAWRQSRVRRHPGDSHYLLHGHGD
ncbi:hypothetical protein [Streptomyces decoyicus]|uniref:hypothetical protein n=1 Tax=Streptomyces decoyicus TaxID=249567 RepID=UPI0036516521